MVVYPQLPIPVSRGTHSLVFLQERVRHTGAGIILYLLFIAVICDILTNPSSGKVDITSDGSLSTATYNCVTGYSLVGVSTRMCQTDGNWDNTIPSNYLFQLSVTY